MPPALLLLPMTLLGDIDSDHRAVREVAGAAAAAVAVEPAVAVPFGEAGEWYRVDRSGGMGVPAPARTLGREEEGG